MNVHALLFDVDGTLLDSSPAYLEIMHRACTELGWPKPGDNLMQQIMTFRRSPIELIFGKDEVSKEKEQALFRVSRSLWEEVFTKIAQPFDDAIETLCRLSEEGFRLGIVTDANHQVVQQVTRHPDCPPMDVVITREESGIRKPSPIPIEMALQGLGLDAESVLYVGDNPTDMEAGRAAGVGTIGITTGPSEHHHLQNSGADHIIRDLAALPLIVNHHPPVVQGRLRSGLNQANGFTGLNWVNNQLVEMLGAEIAPGTVNLELTETTAKVVSRVRHHAKLARHILQPEGDFCRAICHRIELQLPGNPERCIDALILWPEVEHYPTNKLELICPVHVRTAWQLQDGQSLKIRYKGI